MCVCVCVYVRVCECVCVCVIKKLKQLHLFIAIFKNILDALRTCFHLTSVIALLLRFDFILIPEFVHGNFILHPLM